MRLIDFNVLNQPHENAHEPLKPMCFAFSFNQRVSLLSGNTGQLQLHKNQRKTT